MENAWKIPVELKNIPTIKLGKYTQLPYHQKDFPDYGFFKISLAHAMTKISPSCTTSGEASGTILSLCSSFSTHFLFKSL